MTPLILLIGLLWAPLPAAGQGPGGPPPGGMGRGGPGGPPPGMGHLPALPTPEQVDGPLTPANFRRLFIIMGDDPDPLSDAQVGQYDAAYRQHMAATAGARDSARTTLKALQRAMEDGDFDVLRSNGDQLSRLGKELVKQDDRFDDKKVKPILNKNQNRTYKEWKQQQKKAAEEERQRMRPSRPPRAQPETPPQMP